jgi:hypothetical protein
MRFAWLALHLYLVASTSFAEGVDCRVLAEMFAVAPKTMDVKSLAETRGCINDRTWAGADGSKAATPDKGKPQSCQALADTLAKTGSNALGADGRRRLTECIDEAIKLATTQKRPGSMVWQPPTKLPGERV